MAFTATQYGRERCSGAIPGRKLDAWNIGLMPTSLDGSAGHDPYALRTGPIWCATVMNTVTGIFTTRRATGPIEHLR